MNNYDKMDICGNPIYERIFICVTCFAVARFLNHTRAFSNIFVIIAHLYFRGEVIQIFKNK